MWRLCSSTLATMVFVTLCIVCTLPIFTLTCAVSVLLFTIKHRNKLIAGLILWFILSQLNLQVFAEMVEQTTISFCNWTMYICDGFIEGGVNNAMCLPSITLPYFEISNIIKHILNFAVYITPTTFLTYMLSFSISTNQIGTSPYKIMLLYVAYIGSCIYGIAEYEHYVIFLILVHTAYILFKIFVLHYDFRELTQPQLIIVYIMQQFNQSIKNKNYSQYEVYKIWNNYIDNLIKMNNKNSLYNGIINMFTLNTNYHITDSVLRFIKRNIQYLGAIRKSNELGSNIIDYSDVTYHKIHNLS